VLMRNYCAQNYERFAARIFGAVPEMRRTKALPVGSSPRGEAGHGNRSCFPQHAIWGETRDRLRSDAWRAGAEEIWAKRICILDAAIGRVNGTRATKHYGVAKAVPR